MPLVDYSNSESSEDEGQRQATQRLLEQSVDKNRHSTGAERLKLPPLPSGFHDLYASQVRTSTRDDPSLHGGRTRQSPHVEGNWNTHVYIEWFVTATDAVRLETSLAQINSLHKRHPESSEIHSFLKNDLGVALPLHISLSSPITLLTDQLDSFLSHLESRISASRVRPSTIQTTSLAWVSNYDKSRWFLVLRLDQDQKDDINNLLHAVNGTALSFGKSTLYDTSDETDRTTSISIPDLSQHCHISIAWSLKAPQSGEDLATIKPGSFKIPVVEVKIKMGNKIHSTALAGD